jgi:hypothetical protein
MKACPTGCDTTTWTELETAMEDVSALRTAAAAKYTDLQVRVLSGGKYADLMKLRAEVLALRVTADLREQAALATAYPEAKRAWAKHWQDVYRQADEALAARVTFLQAQATTMGLPDPSAQRHSLIALDPVRRSEENRRMDASLFQAQSPIEKTDEERLVVLQTYLRREFAL